jgi:hypothetical protein
MLESINGVLSFAFSPEHLYAGSWSPERGKIDALMRVWADRSSVKKVLSGRTNGIFSVRFGSLIADSGELL